MKTIDTTYNLKEVLKAILFVAGDGVEKDLLAEKLELSIKELNEVVEELKEEYSGENGIHLIEFKNKIQFSSNPNFADYISDVLSPVREKMLTRAALETLAIVAYKQPITKLEIEDVRRVNSDYAVQALMDQDMIEIVGRKDKTGDGIFCALKMTEIYLRGGFKILDTVPQKSVSFYADRDVTALDGVNELIDYYSLKGVRLVVRMSGTEPKVRIMAESEDEAIVERALKDFSALLGGKNKRG